mmetsp:Transcript_20996/g.35425  ORF Transcript_20996/g.35425 Transcript_20996/m.35425 type:complete len:88 (-) Transcript_20996:1282-1545(-)
MPDNSTSNQYSNTSIRVTSLKHLLSYYKKSDKTLQIHMSLNELIRLTHKSHFLCPPRSSPPQGLTKKSSDCLEIAETETIVQKHYYL